MTAAENPLYADSGLGCAAVKTACFGFVISGIFDFMLLPHKINAVGTRHASFKSSIILSVSISQPFPL